MSLNRTGRLWLLAGALGLAACMPSGQRLLTLQVERGPDLLLETHFDVRDSAGLEAIWRESSEVPFSTQVNRLSPDPSDALRARPAGNVQVRILHVDEVLVEATMTGAEFVRSGAALDDWRPSDATIEQAVLISTD